LRHDDVFSKYAAKIETIRNIPYQSGSVSHFPGYQLLNQAECHPEFLNRFAGLELVGIID
jgi:hypothetical protein